MHGRCAPFGESRAKKLPRKNSRDSSKPLGGGYRSRWCPSHPGARVPALRKWDRIMGTALPEPRGLVELHSMSPSRSFLPTQPPVARINILTSARQTNCVVFSPVNADQQIQSLGI